MTRKKKLPNKLSALLRLAVEDAKICEKTPGYELEMGNWHAYDGVCNVCSVCMAGAVMAVEQRVPFRENKMPGIDSPSADDRKLHAINDMRTGEFVEAWEELHRRTAGDALCTKLARVEKYVYEAYNDANSPLGRCHWPVYLRAAKKLERMGL